MATSVELQALLEQHIIASKPAASTTFRAAFASRGLACPAELAELPSDAAMGFLPEVDLESWQVLTPNEVVQAAIPKPSDPGLGLPVVHCYDNTYLVLAPGGEAHLWDAVGDVAFESWPSLAAALRSHLER